MRSKEWIESDRQEVLKYFDKISLIELVNKYFDNCHKMNQLEEENQDILTTLLQSKGLYKGVKFRFTKACFYKNTDIYLMTSDTRFRKLRKDGQISLNCSAEEFTMYKLRNEVEILESQEV